MTTHFWAVPKIGTPAIQIDIEPESLGRNYPLKASVLGDAKSVLVRMLGQIDKSSAAKRAAWIKEITSFARRVVRQIQTDAGIGRGANPSGAHLR